MDYYNNAYPNWRYDPSYTGAIGSFSNPNQYYTRTNPNPPVIPQNSPNTVVFYFVQNKAAADNWLLGKNEKVYLMDSNSPVLYLKTTDQDGRYLPMKTYDLVERTAQVQGPNEAPSIDTSSFVKRDEIDNLVAKAVLNYLNTPAKEGK